MQEIDFWFIWDIFRKKWKMILFVAFLMGAAAGVLSKLCITPIYRSSVSLYLGRVQDNNPLSKAQLLMNANSNMGAAIGSELALGTQLGTDYQQLIKTDVISESVADELAKQGKWPTDKKYKVRAKMVKATRIMQIDIDSDNPIFSLEVARIFAREFINKIQQLLGIQNTQIIEEPVAQMKPVFPIIWLNTLGGFFVGFLLMIFFYVLVRVLDRRVRTSEEIENTLNIPVVGTVHEDKDYALDHDNPLLFDNKEDLEKNRSRLAEDFRVFRVNLINNKPKDKTDGSVIAVTSTSAKDGKTFCTANLGASLAEAGYNVLLVDCDTGKRGLQSYFGKKEEKGLMNILTEEADFKDAVKHNLNGSNMDVLFCGNQNLNSANLMVSPKFKKLMEDVKKKYDYVFLDVSCHLGTADIVSAGSSADEVLLLVRSGKTDSNVIKQTAETLKRANLDISGVILNGVEEE